MVTTAPSTSASNELSQVPNLREALLPDHQQIGLLESRYGLESKEYEEWEHLWTGNPVYKSARKHWPIGWVLEDRDGNIVGFLGNIPVLYEYRGRKLIAAVTHAWVVDSLYRGYSLLLLDCYFRQKNVDIYLSTTVNSASAKPFSEFNSVPVPVGAWDQSDFCITQYRGFTASWMRSKGSSLAGPLSYPLSAALLLKDKLWGKSWDTAKTARNDATVEVCADFDHRFQRFWETLQERNTHLLLAVRSRETLEWHFRYALLQKKIWILAITKGSEIVAYSVFCRQDHQRFGLRRMRLVDFQSLEGNPDLLQPMLSWALKRCHEQGIHMLESIGRFPHNTGNKLLPRQRQLASWLYYYQARDLELANNLTNPEAWNPSWFDGDSSL